MTVPEAVARAVAVHLGAPIHQSAFVGGGCIANATRLDTGAGPFFLKYGWGGVAETFAAEAAGLSALREAASPLVVPEVIAVEAETETCPGFLLMEWVETGPRDAGFWEAFGQGLSALHHHTMPLYGFDRDNYIGRLPQQNPWGTRWSTFFLLNRLVPQCKMADKAGRWRSSWSLPFEALGNRIDDLLPKKPPASILHGDLWSGNVLVTSTGRAALIDAATYYGHREADLAMTELFGGFPDRFYQAYREAWPLEPGYDTRREVYNLYHLLNHLNHFGGSYADAVEAIFKRFAS